MYKFFLCLRYLRTRYIALASIISVMLGVATMIVVNSVMSGFGSEMRDRIHGILADVVVETNSLDGVVNAEQLMALANQTVGDQIEAMSPTVEVYGMLSFQFGGQWMTRPITLIGIDPKTKAKVGPLVNHLDSYHPLKDGDAIIRPALRSVTEPPGWELTDEAKEYRRAWVERQQLFLEMERQEKASGNDTLKEAVPFPASAGNSEAEKAGSPRPSRGASLASALPAESSDVSPSPSATEDPFRADPFASQPDAPQFSDEYESQAVDPAAPWPSRLYVGSGLVEFSYEDRETGKMKTVRMVRPGDDVKISTVSAGRPPDVLHFNATVVDIFKSGMSEYDAQLVFCNLDQLQEARGMINPESGARAITSIQIRLKDYADAEEVVRRLKGAFPPGTFSVKTWEQKQGPLLAAVDVESAILNVLLFLIIAVAGFGILAIFFMIVVEKTRDIGILKALGAGSGGVMSIFLSYGLALGVVGSSVGVGLGLLFVHYINEIESVISWIIGRKVFDERIYYFPTIPTDVNFMMVVWVAFGAMAIAVLASVLPARRAARLHPVEALRYE